LCFALACACYACGEHVGSALCATKVHKIVGMDAPNATFFVWWAKYFEWGWGGECGADGTPCYIRWGGVGWA